MHVEGSEIPRIGEFKGFQGSWKTEGEREMQEPK